MSGKTLSQIIDKRLHVIEDKTYTFDDIKNLFIQYRNGEIDDMQFDDLFYLYYVRDGIEGELSQAQKKILDDFGDIRFSPFPEDLLTGAYIGTEEYRKEILKAKIALGL